jgi:hypothetical protein
MPNCGMRSQIGDNDICELVDRDRNEIERLFYEDRAWSACFRRLNSFASAAIAAAGLSIAKLIQDTHGWHTTVTVYRLSLCCEGEPRPSILTTKFAVRV